MKHSYVNAQLGIIMETKIDLDKVCAFVKDSVQELGDVSPFVILRTENDKYELIHIETRKKQFKVDLKNYINGIGCTEYFSAFTGYSKELNPQSLFNKSRSMQLETEIIDFCKDVISHVETPPSKSLNKTEVLIITKHHKTNGMDSRLYEIFRTDDEISFSKPDDVTNNGSIQNNWDVWNAKQINLLGGVD